MGESIVHLQLVNQLVKRAMEIIPSELHCFLCTDSPYNRNKPPYLGHARPDLYYCFDGLLVVGEAKTSDDILTPHSKSQYDDFFKACSCHKGNAIFLFAVPWKDKAKASNIVKYKLQAPPFNIEILDVFL